MDAVEYAEKHHEKLVECFIKNHQAEFDKYCLDDFEDWCEARADDYRHDEYDREKDA